MQQSLTYVLSSQLQKERKKTVAFTQLANHLIVNCNFGATLNGLPAKVTSVWEQYNALIKDVERNGVVIDTFIHEDFQFPQNLEKVTTPASPPRTPVKQLQRRSDIASAVVTPVKTRRDCFNCSSVQKANSSLPKTLKTEKCKHHQLNSFTAGIKKNLNLKAQKQKLSRHGQKIDEQKKKT